MDLKETEDDTEDVHISYVLLPCSSICYELLEERVQGHFEG